jgi:isoleucyl-tRNA synthetase
VHVRDDEMLAALKSVDFEDVCITSAITLSNDPISPDAFRMPEIEGVGVVFEKADGEKCQRCWKILPDVGKHTHAGTCGRCSTALG